MTNLSYPSTRNSQHDYNHADGEKPPKLLYIHMTALGDAVMASPALRLLKQGLPNWNIDVLARSHTRDYFQSLAYVDRVVTFVDDRYVNRHKPWRLLRGWKDLIRLQRELSGARYTATVQWRQQIPDTLLSIVTRADHRVATIQNIHRRSPLPVKQLSFLFTDLVLCTDPNIHLVEAMAAPARFLVDKLGGQSASDDLTLDYPLQQSDHAAAAAFLHAHELGEQTPFACVNISAKTTVNHWPAERFAAVSDHLQKNHGFRVVLAGIPEHLDREEEIVKNMRTEPVRAVNRIAFGPLCGVLARSSLSLSLNTGIAHIAAALGIPTVVLNGRDGASITPWGTPHRIVTKNSFYPCRHPNAREWASLVPRIAVEEVTTAIDELLSEVHVQQA
jgi:ADP-heptose:LPS heptosyltransferase